MADVILAVIRPTMPVGMTVSHTWTRTVWSARFWSASWLPLVANGLSGPSDTPSSHCVRYQLAAAYGKVQRRFREGSGKDVRYQARRRLWEAAEVVLAVRGGDLEAPDWRLAVVVEQRPHHCAYRRTSAA